MLCVNPPLVVATAVFIFCASHVVHKKNATRKTLVANGVAQKDVCVQSYQYFGRFEMLRT
jgi:hypothetical protein